MAFIRKLPDVPERLEHLKGGAGHLERYAILSPEEMLGAGTVCARMVLQPGCEVGEHTHHGNYEVYYFLSGHGTYRSNGDGTYVMCGDAQTVLEPSIRRDQLIAVMTAFARSEKWRGCDDPAYRLWWRLRLADRRLRHLWLRVCRRLGFGAQ